MSDSTFLFNEIIFGPVQSRRLGVSLGINLLPDNCKLCNFNCIYCECGWNNKTVKANALPKRNKVKAELEQVLKNMDQSPDMITFAGNGEPTMHPEFDGIINDTIELRNEYAKKAKIAVLSNATLMHKLKVSEALNKVDRNILKLDSAVQETYELINQPVISKPINIIIEELAAFKGEIIIQTLFLRGEFKGLTVDNTTENEIDEWLKAIQKIQPSEVMIYTFSRATPHDKIEQLTLNELESIALLVEQHGIKTSVFK